MPHFIELRNYLLYVLFIPLCYASASQTSNILRCSTRPTVFNKLDLGVVPADQDNVKAVFLWKNTTNKVLVIEKIVKSCRCAKVKPNSETIRPGKTVELVAYINASDWEGNAGVMFTVFFVDGIAPHESFKVVFNKPASLHANPKSIHFGIIDDPCKSSRMFSIEWVTDPNTDGMKVDPNISSSNGKVTCLLKNKKSKLIRLPNADINSGSCPSDWVF